ncbi:MAG TPA: PAS domain-containing protein, partial [Gaiellaceae bacterium]|nr:PAS domain-containing protein [Gaiellaceae bacterium]
MLRATWSRPPHWALAAVGVLLEVAVTVPFALFDAQDASAALALLVAGFVAFVTGPRWGVPVAVTGWALFFAFPADQDARAALALPVWIALALLAGLLGDRFRRTVRERELAGNELDAVRERASDAVVELDLDGTISGWNPRAAELYGYAPEELEGEP